MTFEYLDTDLWPAAEAVISNYKKKRYLLKKEKPLKETDSYRPSLIFGKRLSITEVVEIKSEYKIDGPFESFIQQCIAEQRPIKIWVCVPNNDEGDEPSIQVNEERKFRELGVGRFHYDGNEPKIMSQAVECHLRFVLPPGPRLVRYEQINEAINKFNEGRRIDAIRDMGELLEAAVTDLGICAAKKSGKFTLLGSATKFKEQDFEGKINKLGAGEAGVRVIEPVLKADLIASKNTRNLSDHPRNRVKRRELEEQCLAKMGEGVRLLRALARIKSQIR